MLYIDAEFTDNKDIDGILCICYQHNDNPCQSIDLRTNKDIMWFYEKYKDEIWCAHNCESEIFVLKTLGIPVENLKWIDTLVECGMIFSTHAKLGHMRRSLVECAKKLEIPYAFSELKGYMYDLILNNDTYSNDEWDLIIEYCKADTSVMREFMLHIDVIHDSIQDGQGDEQMLKRGEFLKHLALINYSTKGMPINYKNMKLVEENRDEIRMNIIKGVNDYYQANYQTDLYEIKTNKKGITKATFKSILFEILIAKKMKLEWKRTDSGGLCLKQDYVEEMCRHNPQLSVLHEARKTLRDLMSLDGVLKKKAKDPFYKTHFEQIKDGRYIHHTSMPMTQKTSRSSPKPASGFILNCAPWIRNAYIKADEDNVIIEVDYSQQEIGIGAALSGDSHLIDAYYSDDIYMTLAIKAGAAPEGATKKTHGDIRNMYKTIQLGLGYTMGKRSLGNKLFNETLNKDGSHVFTKKQALDKASEVYDWHQKYFKHYWDWTDQAVNDIKRLGFIKTEDWVYYYHELRYEDEKTKKVRWSLSVPAVKNFYCQSTGATMLRKAIIQANKQGLEVICGLHDAVYIRTNKTDWEKDLKALEDIMKQASIDTVPNLREPLRVGNNIYGLGKQYFDPRGDFIFNKIKEIIPLEVA